MNRAVWNAVLGLCLGLKLTASSSAAMPEYRQFALPNGMEVYVFPQKNCATVQLGLGYRVGFGAGVLPEVLAPLVFRDAREGVVAHDYTFHQADVPAREFAATLAQEAERMKLGIGGAEQWGAAREEFLRKRRLEELDQRLFARLRILEHFSLAESLPDTTDSEEWSVAAAQFFYRKHYGPGRAFLVIAGGIAPERAISLVQRHFGTIGQSQSEPQSQPAATLPASSPSPLSVNGWLGYPLPQAQHPDHGPIAVIGELLGPQFEVERYRDVGLALRFVGDAAEPARLTLDQVNEAFPRAKERVLKKWELKLADPASLAQTVGQGVVLSGDPLAAWHFLESIRKVSVEQVWKALETYFQAG